jgi:hypothetical protein
MSLQIFRPIWSAKGSPVAVQSAPGEPHRFTAALDGKTGSDQQQSSGGEVTDINAVRRTELDQDRYFWEGFNDHQPDGHGGQREGLEPAAAALGRSRHLQRVTPF